ncbi:MAG: phage tail tape measure protein [Spirochaetaceae bacterium]|nr:phage tail tape measure protein [Spirochaetaceae bacterium]
MASKYSIEAVFKLVDQVSAPLSRAGMALDKLGIKSKTVNNALKNDFDKAAKRIDKLGASMKKITGGAVLGGVAAVGVGAGIATKQFIEFDSQLYKAGAIFSDLNPLADDFTTRLDAIGKAARAVAAATEFNAQQTASALSTMAMAGIKSEQAISLLPKVADIATAAGLDLDKAVGIAADALAVFGKMTDDPLKLANNFQYVSDIMVKTANLANMDLSLMYEAVASGGKEFSKTNQRIEDFGAAVDILAANAIKGAEAGGAINTMMVRLAAPAAEGEQALKALGIRTQDARGNILNFVDIIGQLNVAFRGLGTAKQAEYIDAIFGKNRYQAASALISAGAEGFRTYSAELEKAAGSTQQAAEVMRKSIQNKLAVLGSAATELGFKFVDAFKDKGVSAIEGLTTAIEKFDVMPLVGFASAAADGIGRFAGALMGAVKTTWQFRYVIAAIIGPIVAYNIALMGIIAVMGIYGKLQLLSAVFTGTQAGALALLKKGTVEYLVVDKLFTLATIIRNGVLNLLTGGMLANAAATAKLAVANKTATAGQWLLNAAMMANPIGLVIGAILILILVVKELFSNWDNIAKAFKDGGIIAGILRIGGTILSAILAPVQWLLEALSKIPGVGDLAGRGSAEIQEFRNFLKGIKKGTTITAEGYDLYEQRKAMGSKAPTKAPTSEIDELMKSLGISSSPYDIPGFGIPGIPGAEGALGGKSKLHGVVDISGIIPSIDGGGTYTAGGAVTNATPPPVSAIPEAFTRTAIEVAAILRRIDAGVSLISRSLPVSVRSELPAISAPETATRISPITPRIHMGGDEGASDYYNPRNIAPVTQAERMAYSLSERRETVVIEVAAEKGTAARIVRAPRDVDIRLVTSGGNA